MKKLVVRFCLFILITSCSDKGLVTKEPFEFTDDQPNTKVEIPKNFVVKGSIQGLKPMEEIESKIDLKITESKKEYQLKNGDFEFILREEQEYSLEVIQSQGHDCIVIGSRNGKIESNISDLKIECSPHKYSFSGLALGLGNGDSSLIIRDIISDKKLEIFQEPTESGDVFFEDDAFFSFADPYEFEILESPPGVTCTIPIKKSSPLQNSVANFVINCSNNPSLSGMIVGIEPGDEITLSLNGSETNVLTQSSGNFSFPETISPGDSIEIDLVLQHPNYDCDPTKWSMASLENVTTSISNIIIKCERKMVGLKIRSRQVVVDDDSVNVKLIRKGGPLAEANFTKDSERFNWEYTFGDRVPQNETVIITVIQSRESMCSIWINDELVSSSKVPTLQIGPLDFNVETEDLFVEIHCLLDEEVKEEPTPKDPVPEKDPVSKETESGLDAV